jgi:hypothetical protein
VERNIDAIAKQDLASCGRWLMKNSYFLVWDRRQRVTVCTETFYGQP